MTTHPIIESFTTVAPLGLCFHDAATGRRILDGLKVCAYLSEAGVEKRKTALLPNRNGVYVLQKVKGLEEFSRGKGDEKFWNENPPNKDYVIEVEDFENRFLGFKFTVELPVKGIYSWQNAPVVSPSNNNKTIPVYSAPMRKINGGMSVIRAELRDVGELPASFAVLEARFDGNLIARGIADRDGKIALVFPSLAPQSDPIVSPPASSTQVSLSEQFWDLDLTVKYQPNIFQTSPPLPIQNSGEEILPDLRLVLAQAEATLWADGGQTEKLKTGVLQTGKELILRSRKDAITSPLSDSEATFFSYLYVSPAF